MPNVAERLAHIGACRLGEGSRQMSHDFLVGGSAPQQVVIATHLEREREILKTYCETELGFSVLRETNIEELIEKARAPSTVLVVLGEEIVGEAIIRLCRGVREAGCLVPIVVLGREQGPGVSAMSATEAGADQYVELPCSPDILRSSVFAWIRRFRREVCCLFAGPISIDLVRQATYVDGRSLDLDGAPYRLLVALARRFGTIVPRETLHLEVCGGFGKTKNLNTHVSHLRTALGPCRGMLRTVTNEGCVLGWPADRKS